MNDIVGEKTRRWKKRRDGERLSEGRKGEWKGGGREEVVRVPYVLPLYLKVLPVTLNYINFAVYSVFDFKRPKKFVSCRLYKHMGGGTFGTLSGEVKKCE